MTLTLTLTLTPKPQIYENSLKVRIKVTFANIIKGNLLAILVKVTLYIISVYLFLSNLNYVIATFVVLK